MTAWRALFVVGLVGLVDAFVPARLVPGLYDSPPRSLLLSTGPRRSAPSVASLKMGFRDWFGGGSTSPPKNKRLGSVRAVGEVAFTPKPPKNKRDPKNKRLGTAKPAPLTSGRIGTAKKAAALRSTTLDRAGRKLGTARVPPPANRTGPRLGSAGGFKNKRIGSIRNVVAGPRVSGRIGSTGPGVGRIASAGGGRSSPEIANAKRAAEEFAMEAVDAAEAALASPEAMAARENAKLAAKQLARRILLSPKERAEAEAADALAEMEADLVPPAAPASPRIGSIKPSGPELKEWMAKAKEYERKASALEGSLEELASEKAELLQQMELMEEILTDQQVAILEESGLVKLNRQSAKQ